ncbi:MAG: rhodanese-like domain-containing protein [Candidatus Muiribacteriaceae bacterium]
MRVISLIFFITVLSVMMFAESESDKMYVHTVTLEQAAEWFKEAEAVFVDVRNRKKSTVTFAACFPPDNVISLVFKVPPDKKLVLFCNTGRNAIKAYHILKENGMSDVYVLDYNIEHIEAFFENFNVPVRLHKIDPERKLRNFFSDF